VAVETLGKALIILAVFLALVGGVFVVLSRAGVDRLPGDIVYRGRNVTVYLPLGLSIVVSIVLTILLNLFWRR
jgi:Protein of unknown function (DUF2905)